MKIPFSPPYIDDQVVADGVNRGVGTEIEVGGIGGMYGDTVRVADGGESVGIVVEHVCVERTVDA